MAAPAHRALKETHGPHEQNQEIFDRQEESDAARQLPGELCRVNGLRCPLEEKTNSRKPAVGWGAQQQWTEEEQGLSK